MRPVYVAVITPYYNESIDVLTHCYNSVVEQAPSLLCPFITHHFFISDGGGFAAPEFQQKCSNNATSHHSLATSHNDNGVTPRAIGTYMAQHSTDTKYDFFCYLDADNWYHPLHISSMLDLYFQPRFQTISHVGCSSFRTFHHYLTEEDLNLEPDPDESSCDHIDTSCLFLSRSTFETAFRIWLHSPKLSSAVCDRVFLSTFKKIYGSSAFVSSKKRTVAFRSKYLVHYRNVPTIPNLKTNESLHAYMQWCNPLTIPDANKLLLEKLIERSFP